MKRITFFKVWKSTIPYITIRQSRLPEEVATQMGFEEFVKKDCPDQYYRPAPKSDYLYMKLKHRFIRMGIKSRVKEASGNIAERLGWSSYTGYEFGLKENKEAETISETLISKKIHRRLSGIKILYLLKATPAPYDESTRKMDFAYTTVANNMIQKLGNIDFIIYFYEDAWIALTSKQKRILCDHELMHCGILGTLFIKDHDIDIKEFKDVAERYGLKEPEYHWASDAVRRVLQDRESEE